MVGYVVPHREPYTDAIPLVYDTNADTDFLLAQYRPSWPQSVRQPVINGCPWPPDR